MRGTGKGCSGGSRRACEVRRVHREHAAAPSGSTPYDGVLDFGMATKVPGRALVVHQSAVVRVQEGAAREINTENGQCTRHCVVVRCIAAAVRLCRTTPSDGVRRACAPRWPRRSRAPAGGKTSKPTHRTLAWGRMKEWCCVPLNQTLRGTQSSNERAEGKVKSTELFSDLRRYCARMERTVGEARDH